MKLAQILAIIVFVVTILFIATGWIDRVFCILLASVLMFVMGAVTSDEVLPLIDIEMLEIIVGMILLVDGVGGYEIFNGVIVKVLKVSKNLKMFTFNLLFFNVSLVDTKKHRGCLF